MAFTTSTAGSGKARLFEFVDALTALPAAGSKYRAVRSSGGAAGGVVSESQGYGLLLAGAILASLQPEDADYQRVMDITHEMFLGWRRMCELSASRGSCQDDEGFQCGGGKYPCLSHWKFDDDLTYVIGSGSAPDGDADALAGMLFAVLAMEQESSPPSWLDEARTSHAQSNGGQQREKRRLTVSERESEGACVCVRRGGGGVGGRGGVVGGREETKEQESKDADSDSWHCSSDMTG